MVRTASVWTERSNWGSSNSIKLNSVYSLHFSLRSAFIAGYYKVAKREPQICYLSVSPNCIRQQKHVYQERIYKARLHFDSLQIWLQRLCKATKQV